MTKTYGNRVSRKTADRRWVIQNCGLNDTKPAEKYWSLLRGSRPELNLAGTPYDSHLVAEEYRKTHTHFRVVEAVKATASGWVHSVADDPDTLS